MSNETELIYSSDNVSKPAHPFIFFVFFIPFGIFSGYLTVTLAYLFSRSGISMQLIAGLAALNLVPQIFKFIWAPLVDITLTLKRWYLLSAVATAATIFASGIIPISISNLSLFSGIILLASFVRSFMSAAINGLAAHDTSNDLKGRVGGYSQAGNLGGSAVGGGAGLWLAQHASYPWMAGAVIALVCLLCCIALFFIKEPVSTIKSEKKRQAIGSVLADVYQNLKTKRGGLAFLLNLLPLGTGAAGFLFAALAKDWGAGANTVALVTGGLGGVAIITGCLIGGWICDKMSRQKAFVYFSLCLALVCLGMAYCPHVPLMYIIWTLAYALINGLVNGAYSAFNLEATGKGAAASKFELYASMAYLPLYFMLWVSGSAYGKWGALDLLNTEAVITAIAAAVFFVAWMVVYKQRKLNAGLGVGV